MYAGDGGGGMPVHPLTAALNRFRKKRRPGMFNRAPGLADMMRQRQGAQAPLPGMPVGVPPGGDPSQVNTPIDPGYNMTSPAQGVDLSAAMGHMADRMKQGMGSVTWGGRTFSDPNKLWGWEKAHGQQMGKGEFWRLHPDAARRLGLPVEDNGGAQFDQADPMGAMSQEHLKAGLIGQMHAAQGALTGTPAPGVQHRVAGRMVGAQRNRMHAVGSAQARSQALASIMARRLRGRQV